MNIIAVIERMMAKNIRAMFQLILKEKRILILEKI